jgi:hypothetical protein
MGVTSLAVLFFLSLTSYERFAHLHLLRPQSRLMVMIVFIVIMIYRNRNLLQFMQRKISCSN